MNKQSLIKEIFDISKEDAIKDYNNLPKNCEDLSKIKPMSRVGSKFVDYFTSLQRLNTVGNKGLTFWDLYENRDKFLKKNYVNKMYKFYAKTKPNYSDIKIWWQISNIYFGSINIFKPTIAMSVYCKYKPNSILDFTMGWGGRLIGATALNISKYTGIDLNSELKKPYNEMVKTLKPLTETSINLIFKDALKVDYSKIDYDLVLTSPPYYNTEIYKGTKKLDKENWNNNFYKPLFTMTFKNLKQGGHYCLNVPKEVYENVCIGVLGDADEFLPLPKALRTTEEKYKEYIYVWKRKDV